MMTMLDLVPQPNQEGDLDNYFISGKQRLNRNNFDAKVNWNRNDRHQLFFKYSAMTALVHGDFGLGEAGGECVCDGGVGDGNTLVQIAGIGQTYTVSPTVVIDGTFGWTRFGQDVTPARPRHQLRTGRARDPGNERPGPAGERHAARCSSPAIPTLGNSESWNPTFRNDQSYTFNTNVSWTKGAHDMRFGFDFVHHLMNHWQPELGEGPRGAFHFDTGVTALNPEVLEATVGFQGDTPSFENDWNGLAGFLLGTPTATGKSSQFIKMNSLENQCAFYGRDRWTRQLEVDARPWTPLGAVPEPTPLGRPGYRVLRPDDQRSVDWRARRNPAGQQRRVEQEALRSSSRIRLPDERVDGDPKRLRDHLPLASLGRSGAAWLVPVDRYRGVRGHQRIRSR